ncbi:hypothetical protein BGX21_004167 [Mortierella sp. AD011]|nr:hypothetical protein BGX20_003775 [Mortierella sp. AD010]KAF9374303.1 hypothetical protein BGX21_004167 [Mortierella sp. AD011]
MKSLNLLCTTPDPTSSFLYGLAYGTNNIYLLQSTANPSNLSAIAWSSVASIQTSALYNINASGGGRPYSCVTNDKGVFTIIAFKAYLSSGTDTEPAGIRYDPTGTPNSGFNQEGPGGWSNIIVDPNYGWQSSFLNQKLFYMSSSGASTPVVVHAYIDSSPKISFGILNEDSKTLTAANSLNLQQSFSVLLEAAYYNNMIYAYGRNESGGALLVGIPFTNVPTVSTTIPTNVVSFNASSTVACNTEYDTFSGTLHNSLYLLCINTIPNTPSEFYIVDITQNSGAVGPGVKITNPSIDYSFLSIVGGNTNGSKPYIFIEDRYAGYYALSLSDPDIGSVVAINDIPDPTNSNSGSGSSKSVIIGATIGAVAVVIAIAMFFIIRRQRRSKAKLAEIHQGGDAKIDPTGDLSQAQEPVVHPYAASTQLYQPYNQAYATQQIQFSSHPRPNVVTTIGHDGSSSVSQQPQHFEVKIGAEEAPSPLPTPFDPSWTPRPFVPPTIPANTL